MISPIYVEREAKIERKRKSDRKQKMRTRRRKYERAGVPWPLNPLFIFRHLYHISRRGHHSLSTLHIIFPSFIAYLPILHTIILISPRSPSPLLSSSIPYQSPVLIYRLLLLRAPFPHLPSPVYPVPLRVRRRPPCEWNLSTIKHAGGLGYGATRPVFALVNL